MPAPALLPFVLPLLLRRTTPGWRPVPGPAAEGAVARALRWSADRRRLAGLDDRLLHDLGLTRADVLGGVPFRRVGGGGPGGPG